MRKMRELSRRLDEMRMLMVLGERCVFCASRIVYRRVYGLLYCPIVGCDVRPQDKACKYYVEDKTG
jgi:hypothetical protein